MKPEHFDKCKKLIEQIDEAEKDLGAAKDFLKEDNDSHFYLDSRDGSTRYIVSREFIHVACDRLTQRIICYKADLETL